MTTTADTRYRDADAIPADEWVRLGDHLAAHGLLLDREIPARRFAGGLANLNYRVSIAGEAAVLRRPPPGTRAEGANDMGREWRVLSRLNAGYPLAPKGLHFCDDPKVLGAEFQIIEFRDGHAIGAGLPAQFDADGARRLTQALIDAMVALHALDPTEVDLETLGKPDGFLLRQVEGWNRRAAAVYPGGPPATAARVIKHLRANIPEASATALLHCDLKFDNLLVDLKTLAPVAVIDWDMATRGDPLFDLGVLLSYWIDPGDPESVHALEQTPSLDPRMPRRAEVARGYFAARGTPETDVAFHFTLARLRLAIAWMQLFRRYEAGVLTGARYADLARVADAVLAWTADTLDTPV